MKICNKCHRELSEDEFYKNDKKYTKKNGEISVYSGKKPRCKRCDVQKGRKQYRKVVTMRHRLKVLVASSRQREKRVGRESSISFESISELYSSQEGKCYLTGVLMDCLSGPFCASLDQIKPGCGYTKENTALTCWIANQLKRDFSLPELYDLCEKIIETSKTEDSKSILSRLAQVEQSHSRKIWIGRPGRWSPISNLEKTQKTVPPLSS